MPEIKKQFMHRWFEEVWNNGNENAIDELFHAEGKAHGLGPDPAIGPAGFKPFYRDFRSKFSDIHVAVDNVYTDGDTAIATTTVTANHAETGKPISFTGVSIGVIKDGQIHESWNYFDFLTMYMQTGKITSEQLM